MALSPSWIIGSVIKVMSDRIITFIRMTAFPFHNDNIPLLCEGSMNAHVADSTVVQKADG